MTQLGLAGPELPKRLRDWHALDPTLQKSVELDTAGRYPLDKLTLLQDLHTSLEALTLDLLCNLVAFISLRLRDTLDI